MLVLASMHVRLAVVESIHVNKEGIPVPGLDMPVGADAFVRSRSVTGDKRVRGSRFDGRSSWKLKFPPPPPPFPPCLLEPRPT